jgi:signal transduction histidine kinase
MLTGPAAATLSAVAVRTAAAIGLVATAYVAVSVVIWHSFYAAAPWRLAGPVTGCATLLVFGLARRWPARWLVVADSGVLIALALSGALWVPPEMRGDTASWLYIMLAAASVFPLWCARLALAAPLILASGAAYWAGVVYLSPVLAPNSLPGASTLFYFVVAAVALVGFRLLRRRAARADEALAAADAAEHEEYIALCRHAERREYERLLHDTVLNTLTALSRPSSDPLAVVGRCRHDVALIKYALGGAERDGEQVGGGRNPCRRVLAAIEAVALEMNARGLNVHLAAASGGQQNGPSEFGHAVPMSIVAAVARAVREALTNVARHAGSGEAWVDVSGAGDGTGELTVTIRDRGSGFDPRRVGPDRLGISRSIVERITDCGGTASVQSSPGDGTTVTLRVPMPAGAGAEVA